MDDAWKEQIQFAYDMVCVATLPLRSYVDRRNAFRFVRSELMERYVHPLDEEIIRDQRAYIGSVFDEASGTAGESEEEGYDSRD